MSNGVDDAVRAASRKPTAHLVWPLVVGVCAMATAACTGPTQSSGGVNVPTSAVATSAPQTSQSMQPVVEPVIDVTTQPGSVPSFVGALKDVSGQTCTAGADGVTASGTVTNPTTKPQDYRIYISVLNSNQTLGVTEVDISALAPGASQQWSGVVAVQMTEPKCVLRVERNDSA